MGTGPLLKGLMVALVALIVLAPVEMLRGLIEERARLRQEAVASVARGWGGEQLVGGPILAIPVTLAPGGNRAPTADIEWYVLPESLTLASELKVLDERRKLGVYEVPVYVRERARRSQLQHRGADRGAHAVSIGRGRASRSGAHHRAGARTRAACATST